MAIANLISNKPGAADDPLIAKLRGPQTVGELLSEDAKWLWPEFSVGQGVGEDAGSYGRGSDAGRFPTAIWGQNPAGPWYVLEALARFRKGDRTAPLLPLESPVAGSETDRMLLSLGMAKSMGDLGLALDLDAQRPSTADARRIQARIQLLSTGGERDKAAEQWKAHISSHQRTINFEELADLTQFAQSNNLPEPLSLLDASRPLHPELMVSLVSADVGAFGSYKTTDVATFRHALTQRWTKDEEALGAAQVRFWLRELWATDSAGLPRQGLKKLGGLWPYTHRWLSRLPSHRRREALDAIGAGGETLVKLLSQSDQGDAGKILLARVWLSAGDAPSALTLLDQWIRANRDGDVTQSQGQQGQDEDPNESYHRSSRTLVGWMRLWADAFGAYPARAVAAGRLSMMLKESYENGPVSAEAWALALDLCSPEAKPALLKSLDLSWFMGRVEPDNMGALVQALAKHAPKSAPLWLRRWTPNDSLQHAKQRAGVYVALGQPKEAAKVYTDVRQRSPWSATSDLGAFNEWRRLDVAQGPELWQLAAKFWKGNSATPLATHLKAHPLDCFSAASALESPKAANEDEMLRVQQSLRRFIADDDAYALLRLKAARHWLPTSWRAAARCIGASDDLWRGPRADAYLLSMKKLRPDDVNGALGDLARIFRHCGDKDQLRATLALLQDRSHPGLKSLQAELDKAPAEKIVDYRIVEGRPAPILPKDLTWALLDKLVEGRHG
jgi:hypothetical protein